jgi:hypothetical protein
VVLLLTLYWVIEIAEVFGGCGDEYEKEGMGV